MIKIKFKKISPDAIEPTRAHSSDAGFDLTATSIFNGDSYVQYGTNIAFDIPEGYVGLLFPRSSVTKKDLMLKNSVGVIDSGYQGEIIFRFQKIIKVNNYYNIGDRIGQIIFQKLPKIELYETTDFSVTERGLDGFGSTGK